MKLADLRKLAKKDGIEGYEEMETKKELIEALESTEETAEAEEAPKEETEEVSEEGVEEEGEGEETKEETKEEVLEPDPEETEEVDLEDMNIKELREVAKEEGINVKGLNKKSDLIEAIEAGPEEEEEEKKPSLGEGIKMWPTPVGSRAERMKEALLNQPKVRILIPFEEGEKAGPGAYIPVTINGCRNDIKKGVYVSVPQSISDIIMDSQKQTVAALNNQLNIDNPSHPKKQSGEGLVDIGA